MAELITGLTAERVRSNLAEVHERISAAAARAGRDAAGVELVVAGKYVALEDLGVLAEAGIATIGENRAQDLQAKVAAYGDTFTWDFIGHLQSRKVKQIAPLVRLIHSVGTDSALAQLERHARPGLGVLVEVNVAGEEGKSGVAPADLAAFLERSPVEVRGLMTMPPQAREPEDSRRWFAALRALATQHGLDGLSMGTTQDYEVAVEEGATLVRIGTSLFA
ncbi:MAG: dependent protein [bacterium]|jgi:pyridoxal phosphate enzyme (YggS family)